MLLHHQHAKLTLSTPKDQGWCELVQSQLVVEGDMIRPPESGATAGCVPSARVGYITKEHEIHEEPYSPVWWDPVAFHMGFLRDAVRGRRRLCEQDEDADEPVG